MWILWTQLGSVSDTFKNILVKFVPSEIESLLLTWIWLFFTIITLVPFFLMGGIPQTPALFWGLILLRAIFDPIAIFLFTYSLRQSEVSKVIPLLTISPVIAAVSSVFINNEVPSLIGWLGLGLVLIGVYLLNLKPGLRLLQPFLELGNKGSLAMLGAALIWGLQVSFFKLGITISSVSYFTFVGTLAVFIAFSLAIFGKYQLQLPSIFTKQNLIKLAAVGFLDGITVYFRMLALVTGFAGYVSALNRTSILYSSLLAGQLLGEKIWQRLPAILICLLGAVLIALS